MSLIIHRCINCHHPNQFHLSVDDDNISACSHDWCDTKMHRFGPPEVIPTWGPDSALQEHVIRPGSRVQGYPHKTCDCTACRDLYDLLSHAA